jgi:hypothetical protein
VAHLDAGDVGNGIQRTGRAGERHTEIAGAGFAGSADMPGNGHGAQEHNDGRDPSARGRTE